MDQAKKTYLKNDIKAIIILVVIFVIALASLYIIDTKTNYLASLASQLISGIQQ